MDKQAFLKLNIEEQINFYNDEIAKGKSFTKISHEIGISKSISEKFKNHGYKLIDGTFKAVNKAEQNSNSKQSIPQIKELEKSKKTSRTIVIDKKLWKQLKIYAVTNDTTISEILEVQARKFLSKNKDK